VFRVVIPARFDSTRLPGKALLSVAGKPMIQWVHERALASGASEVLIATDDARIASAAAAFGAEVVMTATSHTSGTDRIAQVACERLWDDAQVVVNVQADEPLIPSALIAEVAQLLAAHAAADLATLAMRIVSLADFLDPNVVKVVVDVSGRALYFSRAPVPWDRDGSAARPPLARFADAWRHIGLYAYRVATLRKIRGLAPSPLEACEKLEQLRCLENGLRIQVGEASAAAGPDVNTAEDLRRVNALLLP
jgi:3-deoxy-manno-octulosonate cytidylyltransferase (CMP-KDO synthetase)